jgi:hypothetical protein
VRIVGDGLVQVVRHLQGHVHAREVRGAEGAAFRAADGGAGEDVGFLDGEIGGHHLPQHGAEPEGPDAVADEVGRVLADHDTLARHPVAEVRDLAHDRGVGLRARDQLEQLEVPRRVEEVGAQETAAELRGQVRGHRGDAEARGVGGHDRRFPDRRRDAGEELPLDLEVLDHRLEHPVRVRQLLPVLPEVAGPDAGEVLRQVQRRWLQLAQVVEGWRGDIEERDVQPGAGQVRGDLGSHRPRAEHDDLPDHAGAAAPS